jgi:hypothetical protein
VGAHIAARQWAAQRGTQSLLRSRGEDEQIGADRSFFRNSPTRQGKEGLGGSRAPQFGSGVICENRALRGAAIPAKTGIYSASHWKRAADGLDSRFRGNDQCSECDPIPNDTTTHRFYLVDNLPPRVVDYLPLWPSRDVNFFV